MTPTEQELYLLTNRVIKIETTIKELKDAQTQWVTTLNLLTENIKEIQKALMRYNALDDGVKGFKIDLKTLQDKLAMVDSNFDKRIAKIEVKPIEPKPKKRWFEI